MTCFDSLLYNVPRWIENVLRRTKGIQPEETRQGNKEIKIGIEGGSLTRKRRKPWSLSMDSLKHFVSLLCVLWEVNEAILWCPPLSLVMIITSVEGCKDPALNLITQKAPSSLLPLFFWRIGLYRLLEVG